MILLLSLPSAKIPGVQCHVCLAHVSFGLLSHYQVLRLLYIFWYKSLIRYILSANIFS
jgi:hypothetical protein